MRKLVSIAAAVVALAVPASAVAWAPITTPGQMACISNGNGTWRIDVLKPGEVGHQPENGTCEGPLGQPPAQDVITPTPPAPPAPVTPTPAAPQPPAQDVVPPTPAAPQPPAQDTVTPTPAVPESPAEDVATPETPRVPDHIVVHGQRQPRGAEAGGTPVAKPTPQRVNAQELTRNGELAYTGVETLLVALAGLGLLGAGLLLRRKSAWM